MEELLVQAYVSTENTFCVTCPKCKHEKLLRLSDFPPNAPPPLTYPCACGVSWKIMLNHCKTIVQGRLILTRIILDDAQRSRLDLPCVVCSIKPDHHRLMLGLRFEGLNEAQKQALGYYTMSLRS